MSQSEDSARDDGDTLMDTDDTHFIQPAPPDKLPASVEASQAKPCPEGNTIMITNKYAGASQTHNANNSIMILTAHPDVSNITSSSQINICINNHFSDSITSSSATVSTEGAKGEAQEEPDSTTCHFKDSRSQASAAAAAAAPPPKEAHFVSGDEVLVHRDDLFYLGTVMHVYRKQCLVTFGDDTKCWAYFHEMRKIAPEAEGPACVHCKERGGQEPDSVVDVCQRCQRGFHKKCSGVEPKTGGIHCKRCFEQNSLNGVNGGRYCSKNNNLMGDERLSYSDNSLSPFDTGNFFRSSDYKDAWSGSPNSDLSTGSSNGNYKGRKFTCGRRLRERQEKNYAENTRRTTASVSTPQPSSGCSDASSSSSSSSSLVNFSAATFLSQQLLSSQRVTKSPCGAEKGGGLFGKIFDTSTPTHLANGNKYVIRGKRMDSDGNIQYLVEWEGVS
ncbi:uncharacterized protein LOC132262178 [Phlebotomus argentipes]|uniref:uncharacterized protein LOC132262178 n=1 Tax=Phlebotomus argentipes TaxID=94469 RepID=UPI00289321A2|nr:uncharacterized protein LOC132262178 [Phlebotomus argentipes]